MPENNQTPQQPVPQDPQSQDDTQITQPSALPGDNGTPFQPAADDDLVLGDAHQLTDNMTNIDSDQLYQEGLAAAAGGAEPRDPGIAGYTPPAEEQKDEQ